MEQWINIGLPDFYRDIDVIIYIKVWWGGHVARTPTDQIPKTLLETRGTIGRPKSSVIKSKTYRKEIK